MIKKIKGQKMSDLVTKGNVLVEASHKLNEIEQRLILLAIVKARAVGDTVEQLMNKELEIHASDYMNAYNVDKTTAYRTLKAAVIGLYEAEWGYRYVNNKGNLVVRYERFTQSAEYIENEATVKFMFSYAIIPYLVELEKCFTTYEIKQIANLQSRYAMRLYEMLVQFRSTGKLKIKLDELRFRLGLLDNEYTIMGNFKMRVLDLAVNQINEHTNLKVEYTQKKRGRIIESFEFTFTEKTNSKKEKLVNGDYTITDSQLTFFSSKLSQLHELGKYSKEANYEHYAMRIAKELKESAEKRAFYKPYLEKVGFKFNFVEAVEPVPTAPKQQKAIEAPANSIPAPVPPVSGGDSDIGLEMLEKLKLDLENLKQKKSISSI